MKRTMKALLSLLLAVVLLCQTSMPVQATTDKSEATMPKMTKIKVKGEVTHAAEFGVNLSKYALVSEYDGASYITIINKKGKIIETKNITKLLKQYIKKQTGENIKNANITCDEMTYRYQDRDKSAQAFYAVKRSDGLYYRYYVNTYNWEIEYYGEIETRNAVYYGLDYYRPWDEKATPGKNIKIGLAKRASSEDSREFEPFVPITTNVKYKSKNEKISVQSIYNLAKKCHLFYLIVHDTKKDTYRYYTTTDAKTFKKVPTIQNINATILDITPDNSYLVLKKTNNAFEYLVYNENHTLINQKTFKITNTKKANVLTTRFGTLIHTGSANYIVAHSALDYNYDDNRTIEFDNAKVPFSVNSVKSEAFFYNYDNETVTQDDNVYVFADKKGYIYASTHANMMNSFTKFSCNAIKGKKYTRFTNIYEEQLLIQYTGAEQKTYDNCYLFMSTGNKANHKDAVTYMIPIKNFIKKVK